MKDTETKSVEPKARSPFVFLAGLSAGLLVGVGMLIGGLAAIGAVQLQGDAQPSREFAGGNGQSAADLQDEIFAKSGLLNATASHSSDNFAMATGPIDEGAEGLFMLDYLTGELQCWVLNYRSGLTTAAKFNGAFKHNILRDLGVERGKTPKFVMVTGVVSFRDAAALGAVRPAASVVYVADANSGNVAVYGVPWNSAKAAAGGGQGGALSLIAKGSGRSIPVVGGGDNQK